MRRDLPIALAFLSCIAIAQERRSVWTDKNNAQAYAAYMLQSAYYERGYLAAYVDFKPNATGDVYVVNRGALFHFKEVRVLGMPENLAPLLMADEPKAGEVYSMGRVDDWLIQGRNRLAAKGIAHEFSLHGIQLNREDASVTVTVSFR